MIRNIVFDMGMVLLNWKPMLPCLRIAGDEEKADALCKAVFLHPEWGQIIDGGAMTETDYFARCRERLETEELKQMCDRLSQDWWLDALYPMVGIDTVIETLLEKGFDLYILSNCGRRFHDFKYKIPYITAFKGILVSAEERMLKPEKRIYQRLFDKFGLKPEECLFVDDLARNIEGAEAAGMQGYCHADGDAAKLLDYLLNLKGD